MNGTGPGLGHLAEATGRGGGRGRLGGPPVSDPRPGAAPVSMRSREDLLLRLQPLPGQRLARECLVPMGASALVFPYLGDMQLRFIFDQPGAASLAAARSEDFARLDLTPARAMALASANLRRVLGTPQIASLGGGIYSLRSAQPEYSPLALLDRGFWRAQLEKFPRGLLAALPRKGLLIFAPAGDAQVERELLQQAARMLAGAEGDATSACVYRFDDTGWNLHSDLAPPQPKAPPQAQERQEAAPAQDGVHGREPDLDKVASGQKMLVYSILAGFFVNAMFRANIPPVVLLVAVLALNCYSLAGVVRLSSGLAKSTTATIVYMVLDFVPLLGLISWIVLSIQATRALREAGWQACWERAHEDPAAVDGPVSGVHRAGLGGGRRHRHLGHDAPATAAGR
jgi:hypothetical protein